MVVIGVKKKLSNENENELERMRRKAQGFVCS